MEELGSGLKGNLATVRKISNVENRSREEKKGRKREIGREEKGRK
jgi:hypothetical protein